MADQELGALRREFLHDNLGQPSVLIHTAPPGSPGLDLAVWSPEARDLPYVTVATDGLSEQRLPSEKAPPGWACERAELIMYLPQFVLDPQTKQVPWELAFLHMVAGLPAQAGIPLHAFFVVANGDPPKPFIDDSVLTHGILLPPSAEPVEFRDGFDAPDGSSVEYLWLDFFSTAEAYILRDSGNARLLQMLASAGHAPPTRFARPCLVGAGAAGA
jgi:hypothetical protein